MIFATRCCQLAIQQRDTPTAVHLRYPQILNDQDSVEHARTVPGSKYPAALCCRWGSAEPKSTVVWKAKPEQPSK